MEFKVENDIEEDPLNMELSTRDDGFFDCSVCGGIFETKRGLLEHKKKDHLQDLDMSDDSDSMFQHTLFQEGHFMDRQSAKSILSNKIILAPSEQIRPSPKIGNSEVCHICDKKLKNQFYLKAHMRTFHSEPNTIFRCDCCKKKYIQKKNLIRHLKSNEMMCPYKLFECSLCPNKYKHKSHLDDHFTSKHTSTEFPCEICHRKYKFASSLSRHIKKRHSTEGLIKKFECKHCGKKYSSKTSLDWHVKIHSTEFFYCNLCDYKTTYKNNLKLHNISRHTVGCGFACNHCSKQFKLKRNLTWHVQKHHNGQ